MLRDTLVVLAQSLEPYRRRLQVLCALVALAVSAVAVIAPFDQFSQILTGRPGRPFHLTIRSILQYDFGFVWYPVLGLFILSSILLPALSRRTGRRQIWVLVALIPSCVVLSLTLWSLIFFLSDVNFPGIRIPDAFGYTLYALLPALLILTPIVALFLARGMELPQLALSVAATIFLLGWFGVISSVAATATDYGIEPKISLVLSALAMTWGAYALSAMDFCAILSTHGPARLPTTSSRGPEVNVGAYLSSARNLSILLLIFVLVSANVAFSYLSRVVDLQSARRELAFGIAARDLNHRAELMEDSEAKKLFNEWQRKPEGEDFNVLISEKSLEGVGTLRVALTLYHAYSPGSINWVGVKDVKVDVTGRINWTARESLAGTTGLSGPGARALEGESSVQELLRATARRITPSQAGLSDIAFQWGIDAPVDAPDLIYRHLERAFVTREVNLPSVGFGVSSSAALWWLSLGTLVLSILVRNQIGLVEGSYSATQPQPWLVLDLSKGLERVLANLWLWTMLVAPWIVGGFLMATVNGKVIADGVSDPLVPALARVAGLVTIPIVGGWVGASLVAKLLMLRRQRYSWAMEGTRPIDSVG